ncbi:hypothetical protein C9J85_00135 [Haloferax sp. wsp5]|nr:hypothetical protein C9J85_00135 [Haloferax sp. wsp5]
MTHRERSQPVYPPRCNRSLGTTTGWHTRHPAYPRRPPACVGATGGRVAWSTCVLAGESMRRRHSRRNDGRGIRVANCGTYTSFGDILATGACRGGWKGCRTGLRLTTSGRR